MRTSRIQSALLFTALLVVAATALATPARHPARHAARKTSALAAEAKVGRAAAQATALARVPGGKLRSSELEREHGKLVYSFDIKVAGKPGIEEVIVDAINGGVISVEHEDAKAEKAEALKERAEARRDSAKSK